MNNRGVVLELENKYARYLYDILGLVDLDKYIWYISFQQIYPLVNNKLCDENIFEMKTFLSIEDEYIRPDILTSQEFRLGISRFDQYYMVFATILAYPVSNIMPVVNKMRSIHSYEDFLRSECFMYFCCVDCTEVFIYCKDTSILEKIVAVCDEKNIKFIRYLTDANDNIRFD